MGKAIALLGATLFVVACVAAGSPDPPRRVAPSAPPQPPLACPSAGSRVVASHLESVVSVDNATVISAIALAAATQEDVSVSQLSDVKNTTTVTCVRTLVAQGALMSGVVEVARTCEKTVRLDPNDALAAIALARSGLSVALADVLTIRMHCQTTSTDEQVVALSLIPHV